MSRFKSMFWKYVFRLVLCCTLSLPLLSWATSIQTSEDEKALQELLAVLDEETEVATKTKMNNDYVPGMVTILHGEHLEALGIHTVAEAMGLVPGIQVSRFRTGQPTLKVRGFSFPFNAGNVKVMLNSIALSRESSGINSSVLLIPVAQVDRIEVIRGPGSSIYGDFAMAGVVNIITKTSGGRVFVQGGNDGSRGTGGHYGYQDEKVPLDLSVNVSAVDGADRAAEVDSEPDEDRYTAVFNFNYKGFSLTAQGVRRDIEINRLPPGQGPPPGPGPPPQGRGSQTEESWVIEGRQIYDLSENTSLEGYISYLYNDWDSNAPPAKFNGHRIETGLDIKWSPWSGHQVLFGAVYADSTIDNALNEEPSAPHTIAKGVDRRNFSFTLQDQVTVNDQLSLTLGLRFDDYDDIGSLFTPRIAGVYRLGDHHVLKAQYSQGFRGPTFWELYKTGIPNSGLDFEVIETTELSYVFRRPNMVGRITLYYSKINDGIYGRSLSTTDNFIDIESKGVEFEWEQQLGEKFRWHANFSYVDVSDDRSQIGAGGAADWLGNIAVFFEPIPKYMITGRLLVVHERHAPEGYEDGYESLDFTVSRKDLFKKGITVRLGVKNALNEKITYLSEHPGRVLEDEFSERALWMQVSYDF